MAPLRWMAEAFKDTDLAPLQPNFDRDIILFSGRGNRNKSAPTKKFYDFVLSMVCYCLLKDPNTKQTTVVGQIISGWASLGDVHFWETDGLGTYTYISLEETKVIQGRKRLYLVYKFTHWLGQPNQQAIMEPYRALRDDRAAAAAVAPDKTTSASVAGIAGDIKPPAMVTSTATTTGPNTPSASTKEALDRTTAGAIDPMFPPSPPMKKRNVAESAWHLKDIEPIQLEKRLEALLDSLDTDDTTGPDSSKQQVKDYEVINGYDEDGNPIVLDIEDCPEFWQFLEGYRRKYGNTSAKAGREAKQRATGAATDVSNSTLQKLEAMPVDRDAAWVQKQVTLLVKTEAVMAALQAKGIVPPRKDWTWVVRDQVQTLLGAIMSAGTLDTKLVSKFETCCRVTWSNCMRTETQPDIPCIISQFDVIMAMRKLDLFEVKKLGTEDKKESKELLRKLQNLFLFCGFNYWTYGK